VSHTRKLCQQPLHSRRSQACQSASCRSH
jgi:hypothetical protein